MRMRTYLMIVNLISILSFVLSDSKTYIKPNKKLLDEHELDTVIKLNLDRARQGYPKVQYNLSLMDIAQFVANQLASRGVLQLPYIRIYKQYIGYAFKYQGYIKSAKSICFKLNV